MITGLIHISASQLRGSIWVFFGETAAQPVDHGGKCTTTTTTENDSFSSGADEDIKQLQQAHHTAEEEPEGD